MTYNKRHKSYKKGKGASRRRSSFFGSLMKVLLPFVLLAGVGVFVAMNLGLESLPFINKLKENIIQQKEENINTQVEEIIEMEEETEIVEEVESDEKIYTTPKVPPHFPSCENIDDKYKKRNCTKDKAIGFIYDKLEYPTESFRKGVGKVSVRFVVDKEGNVINPEIYYDSNGFGDAVMKAVQAMPPWIPGKQAGVPVHVEWHLHIDIDEKQYIVSDTSEPLKSDVGHFIVPQKMAYFTECEGMTDGEKYACNKRHLSRQIRGANIYGGNSISIYRGNTPESSPTHFSFVVNKEGNITNIKTQCKREHENKTVDNKLKNMPQWIPAKYNGKPVNVELVFPCRTSSPGY